MSDGDYDGPILEIDKLSISFFTRLREIPAVMDFSATVMPGEGLEVDTDFAVAASTGLRGMDTPPSWASSSSGPRCSVGFSPPFADGTGLGNPPYQRDRMRRTEYLKGPG